MAKATGLTLEEANNRLPLVRVITRDARQLKADILLRQSRLHELRAQYPREEEVDSPYAEEVQQMEESIDDDEGRVGELAAELNEIGAILVDAAIGLVEFESVLGGEQIWLSWEYDEPEVTHWRAAGESPDQRRPLVLIGQEG